MRTFSATAAILVSCGGALAQVSVHDNGSTVTGGAFSGPMVVNPVVNPRGGGIVYNSSIETGFRATGGSAGFTTGAPADPNRLLFDDVPIANADLGGMTSLDVCRVTVGIRRLANAPATDVNVFWSTMTTAVTAPDTQLDTPPNALGSVSLAAAPAAVTELITFGASGGPALFTVPLNTDILSGFGTFSIGVGLSDTGGLNGWRMTNGPSANANVFWLYDPAHTAQANDEGAYLFSNTNPPNPLASFYIIVEGTPVPAPAGAALLGMTGLLAIRRRR
jgi:MYXO-CTERM domain-containing protein